MTDGLTGASRLPRSIQPRRLSAAVSHNLFLSPNDVPQNAVFEITGTASARRQRARAVVAPEHLENRAGNASVKARSSRRSPPRAAGTSQEKTSPSLAPLPAALQTSQPHRLLPLLGARGPDHSPGCDIGLCKLTRIITMRFVKQSPFGGGNDYSLLL